MKRTIHLTFLTFSFLTAFFAVCTGEVLAQNQSPLILNVEVEYNEQTPLIPQKFTVRGYNLGNQNTLVTLGAQPLKLRSNTGTTLVATAEVLSGPNTGTPIYYPAGTYLLSVTVNNKTAQSDVTLGIKGLKGEQGLQGEQGPKGDKGDTGLQGLQGVQGVQGLKGEKGEQGIQGLKGDKGDTGPQGPRGDVGPQGPQGPRGERGDSAVSNSFQKNWTTLTQNWTRSFVKIPDSEVTFTTSGGALFIFTDITLHNTTALSACEPIIDNQWAGSFGNYPLADSMWREGMIVTNGYTRWSKSRIYTNIPAGTHTLAIQCVSNTGTLNIGYDGVIGNSWGGIELK